MIIDITKKRIKQTNSDYKRLLDEIRRLEAQEIELCLALTQTQQEIGLIEQKLDNLEDEVIKTLEWNRI